ncbi:MAG: PIN domain-containing protein [Dehalococcoidia bacterium]|nr:PIN domain-containing protein [Dehalococcoidia bacterium]MYK25754.1 PIN domain-containing protein [Dehalococcoidia bacterium]
MARWLVDTDVLIDVALGRESFVGPSREVIQLLRERGETLLVAWHTISNFYYNLERPQDAAFAKDAVAQLLEFTEVAKTGTEDAHYALTLPIPDFEDAMQVAAARACDAQFILTRNVRDYVDSPVPALSPTDALAELSR